MRAFAFVTALLLGSGGASAFDCTGVKLPSSLVICSDPELTRLADERQEAFSQAMARLDSQQQEELLTDQNGWVRSYATACGAPPDRAPPSPVPDAMRECFKRAAQPRIVYIRAYVLAGGAAAPVPPTVPSIPSAAAAPRPSPTSPAPAATTGNAAQVWWCPSANAYYPWVATCAVPWRAVNSYQPPAQSSGAQQAAASAEAACLQRWAPVVRMSPTEYARYMQERQTRCAEAGRRAAADQVAAEERRRAQEEQERVKRQREAQEAAEREAREAQARIARVEADRKYQVAVSEQERITRDRGYKPITFQDFALDGKELAASDAKIAIKGVYIKRGEIEMLFPSMLAAIMAEETFQRDAGVALLTEDAERNASVQRQS